MNNQDKYFKGQQENEEFICFFRHHWVTLLQEFMYFIVFMAVVVLVISYINTIKSVMQNNAELKAFFVIGFALGTAYLHKFFMRMFTHFVNIGIITDMRIIDCKKTLFFRDTVEAIDMINIQDIEQKGEGLLPNILGYGDINIYLTASNSVKIFRRVTNAKFHFRCISRQKELRRMHRDRDMGTFEEKIANSDVLDQQRQVLMEELKGLKQHDTIEV
ncbi:MAG: PH domain-containing protein [Candidatus Gracilibacteria bacterium]